MTQPLAKATAKRCPPRYHAFTLGIEVLPHPIRLDPHLDKPQHSVLTY